MRALWLLSLISIQLILEIKATDSLPSTLQNIGYSALVQEYKKKNEIEKIDLIKKWIVTLQPFQLSEMRATDPLAFISFKSLMVPHNAELLRCTSGYYLLSQRHCATTNDRYYILSNNHTGEVLKNIWVPQGTFSEFDVSESMFAWSVGGAKEITIYDLSTHKEFTSPRYADYCGRFLSERECGVMYVIKREPSKVLPEDYRGVAYTYDEKKGKKLSYPIITLKKILYTPSNCQIVHTVDISCMLNDYNFDFIQTANPRLSFLKNQMQVIYAYNAHEGTIARLDLDKRFDFDAIHSNSQGSLIALSKNVVDPQSYNATLKNVYIFSCEDFNKPLYVMQDIVANGLILTRYSVVPLFFNDAGCWYYDEKEQKLKQLNNHTVSKYSNRITNGSDSCYIIDAFDNASIERADS